MIHSYQEQVFNKVLPENWLLVGIDENPPFATCSFTQMEQWYPQHHWHNQAYLSWACWFHQLWAITLVQYFFLASPLFSLCLYPSSYTIQGSDRGIPADQCNVVLLITVAATPNISVLINKWLHCQFLSDFMIAFKTVNFPILIISWAFFCSLFNSLRWVFSSLHLNVISVMAVSSSGIIEELSTLYRQIPCCDSCSSTSVWAISLESFWQPLPIEETETYHLAMPI